MHMQEYNKFNTLNARVQEGKMYVCLNTSISICIMSYFTAFLELFVWLIRFEVFFLSIINVNCDYGICRKVPRMKPIGDRIC